MIARDITRDCELLFVFAIALLGVAYTTIARAERGVSTSANDLASACPAEAHVRQRLLARVEDRRELIGLSFALDVQPHEAGLRLTLDTERSGVRGSRVFDGATCEEVVDAAVLLLTLMLEADAEDEPLPAPPPPPPRTARRVYPTLRAAAVGELGYLPRAGVGAELGAGLSHRASRFELNWLWLPRVESERGEDGSRVAIGLWAARLGYCHHLVGRGLALFGCLGLELGRASGRGVNLALQRERAYPWSAGHASLRASVALGRHFALLLEPALVVPFARRRFVSVDAEGTTNPALHTPGPVSGRAAIAIEALF